jgi:hypothetical protein
MMALRFFMGVTEAGYGPGIPYLLSFFYLRHELGLRIGFFLAAAPLANTFAGALAYGITSGHTSIASWRLLFLVEGLPTICMAPIAWFFLPDSPAKARFLNEDEKRVAVARGVRQVGTAERIGSVSLKDIAATFLDLKAWFTAVWLFPLILVSSILTVGQFSLCISHVTLAFPPCQCSCLLFSKKVSTITLFQSRLQLTKSKVGFTAVNAQGLTAPPFFLSFLLTIATTWVADKTQQRGIMIMCLTIIGGVGYIMLAVAKSVGARYAGVFLAAAGIFPAIANILPWVLST